MSWIVQLASTIYSHTKFLLLILLHNTLEVGHTTCHFMKMLFNKYTNIKTPTFYTAIKHWNRLNQNRKGKLKGRDGELFSRYKVCHAGWRLLESGAQHVHELTILYCTCGDCQEGEFYVMRGFFGHNKKKM